MIVVCGQFSKLTFLKNSFKNTIRVSNSLDPDQARHFVGPDLDPNCLEKLSAEDTSMQRVTSWFQVPFSHILYTLPYISRAFGTFRLSYFRKKFNNHDLNNLALCVSK